MIIWRASQSSRGTIFVNLKGVNYQSVVQAEVWDRIIALFLGFCLDTGTDLHFTLTYLLRGNTNISAYDIQTLYITGPYITRDSLLKSYIWRSEVLSICRPIAFLNGMQLKMTDVCLFSKLCIHIKAPRSVSSQRCIGRNISEGINALHSENLMEGKYWDYFV